jgi:hypothetical protein
LSSYSRAPTPTGPWATHLIDDRIDRAVQLQDSVGAIDGVPISLALLEQGSTLDDLEMHDRAGTEAQFLTHGDRNGDLAFRRQGTPHE